MQIFRLCYLVVNLIGAVRTRVDNDTGATHGDARSIRSCPILQQKKMNMLRLLRQTDHVVLLGMMQ